MSSPSDTSLPSERFMRLRIFTPTIHAEIAVAIATLLMAKFATARTILIWLCLPGVMAGIFYSGHGEHPRGAWVLAYLVNSAFYLALALIVQKWRNRGVS